MKIKFFPNFIKNITNQVINSHWVTEKRKNSIWMLNLTQFFGVINDNLYRLLLAFLCISILGQDKASAILSMAGAVYVLPFLLFSSSAGILADRFSKQKMIVILKLFEVIITLLIVIAFYYKSMVGAYSLLFLLATHSALFGPPKYGIIPELVSKDNISKANGMITAFTYMAMIFGTFLASFIPELVSKDNISKANGMITAFTYMAMIFGTFLASFITEISSKNFVIAALVCLVVAIFGLISSFCIKKTAPQDGQKKMNFLFIREIYHTLQFCKEIKYLRQSIFGSAFFLFIGSFAQLNIIPFSIESLGLSDVIGGYLFLIIAIGIAIGSYFCGKWMKSKIELGISCIAGFALGIVFILLSLSSFSLMLSGICLILMGVCGGIFVIPFDTFNQINSPIEKRGQVIAAANFLSFTGVLVASIALYVLNDLLKLPPSLSFFLIGLFTLFISFLITLRLSGTSLHFIAKKIILPISKVNLDCVRDISNDGLFLLENSTIYKTLLFIGMTPEVHLLLPKRKNRPFWYNWIHSMDEIDNLSTQDEIVQHAKKSLKKHAKVCLLLRDELNLSQTKSSGLKNLFSKEKIYSVKINKEDDGQINIKVSSI